MALIRPIRHLRSTLIPAFVVAISLAIAVAAARAQGTAAAPQAGSAPAASAAPSPGAEVAAPAAIQPEAAARSAPAATPGAAPTPPPPNAQGVISYLSDVINWYSHLGSEAQLVRDPDEMLFFADDRQTAGEVLKLAFDYAHAQAAYIAKTAPKTADDGASGGLSNLAKATKALDADADKLRSRIADLQTQLARAPAARRDSINSHIQDLQSQLDLNQARADALKSLAQFQSGSASSDSNNALASQIDELERSFSDSGKKAVSEPAAGTNADQPRGILSIISELFTLSSKLDALDQNIAYAQSISARANGVKKSVIALISKLNAKGNELAQNSVGDDVAALQARKKEFDRLLDEHKFLSAAALPLSKQIVLLGIYTNNVARWRAAIQQRWDKELRSLIVRLIALASSLALIFLGSLLWKWLTIRYVADARRRGQVMAARRLVLGILIVVVLLINFSDQIGSAATVLGFAAAGIAVALQNVILSIAGYFFLIGRFGIKAGDRVQIGGVTGDVIDIGLVKLSLMELSGTGTHREPTGRVVVFSNSIVFQPSGNFFKQAPGTSFVWNEVRLTLAPDVNYRLAEKRLLEVVDEVFARYRDRVMRDYRHLERDLNVMLETPKPQSRLHLSQSGLEIVIRYPADTYSAPQITDEISRRLLDAINREPSLRLATSSTANILSQIPPAGAPADNIDQVADANGQSAARTTEIVTPEKPAGPPRAQNK